MLDKDVLGEYLQCTLHSDTQSFCKYMERVSVHDFQQKETYRKPSQNIAIHCFAKITRV